MSGSAKLADDRSRGFTATRPGRLWRPEGARGDKRIDATRSPPPENGRVGEGVGARVSPRRKESYDKPVPNKSINLLGMLSMETGEISAPTGWPPPSASGDARSKDERVWRRAVQGWRAQDREPGPRAKTASQDREPRPRASRLARRQRSTHLFRGLAKDGRWCCKRGLNSRPLPYQGSALPLSYCSNAGSVAPEDSGSGSPGLVPQQRGARKTRALASRRGNKAET